ncbi:DUF6328 family protein, partial [Streptomyces sp. NPDC002573]|uniref:DUF6328 family protein n=1 Tax=Streptomyces sp. NPDC002573 TaxID=3364651 RepID=UPI0036B37EBD
MQILFAFVLGVAFTSRFPQLSAFQRGIYAATLRVVGLDESDPCRLRIEAGHTVTARDVVVATHYPIFDRAMLFARLSP